MNVRKKALDASTAGAPSGCDGVVVVVDDDTDTRELLQELLESKGYRVMTADDGDEALRVFAAAASVCFVVMDLAMPRMNGLEVLTALAAAPDLRARICISTATPEHVPAGVCCLPKPIDVSRLLALVGTFCPDHAPS